MATINAEFDGRVFIPCQPVNLPPGTQVGIVIPEPPRPMTEEEKLELDRRARDVMKNGGRPLSELLNMIEQFQRA